MGRVEKILVAAILGVVALILGVTAFLPDGDPARGAPDRTAGAPEGSMEAGGDPGGALSPSRGASLSGGAVDTPLGQLLAGDREGPPPASGRVVAGGEDEGLVGGEPGEQEGPPVLVPDPGPRPGSVRRGRTFPGDPRFVRVEVLQGETLGEIVLRECGSLRYLSQARMLNEGLDLDRIRAGQVLVLPYVSEEALLAAREAAPPSGAGERSRAAPLSTSVPVDAAARPGPGPGPDRGREGGETYRVQRGDTLWGIAESRWGRAKAPAKVQEILRLNRDRVPNERALREGVVLRLP